MNESQATPSTERPIRIAIIGAGPIGLACALRALQTAVANPGLSFRVFERGEIGENISAWGHVRLFTPTSMNLPEEALRPDGSDCPGESSCLTGHEFVDRHLRPIAGDASISSSFCARTRVLSVTRAGLLKHEAVASAARESAAFELLVEHAGETRVERADIVIDASGVYGSPNRLGAGGGPVPGEEDVRECITFHIEDVLGRDRAKYENKSILLVGGGYSAASTAAAIRQLIDETDETKLIWLTRRGGDPMHPIADDRLPERASLRTRANAIANETHPRIQRLSAMNVRSMECDGGRVRVTLATEGADDPDAGRTLTVDRIAAHVGFRPDRSIYEELHVHECYATGAPMRIAASLMASDTNDCLARSVGDAELLRNPEPHFYLVGAKSYGRDSTFLMRNGYEQVRQVFGMIERDFDLLAADAARAAT